MIQTGFDLITTTTAEPGLAALRPLLTIVLGIAGVFALAVLVYYWIATGEISGTEAGSLLMIGLLMPAIWILIPGDATREKESRVVVATGNITTEEMQHATFLSPARLYLRLDTDPSWMLVVDGTSEATRFLGVTGEVTLHCKPPRTDSTVLRSCHGPRAQTAPSKSLNETITKLGEAP